MIIADQNKWIKEEISNRSGERTQIRPRPPEVIRYEWDDLANIMEKEGISFRKDHTTIEGFRNFPECPKD